jgi:hypothetical protein
LLDVGGPLRRNDAELGHVTADRVDQLNTLANQRLADAMDGVAPFWWTVSVLGSAGHRLRH